MTVGQHLDYVLRQMVASTAEREERLAGTLAIVRLLDRRRRYPAELSGGERQRLALARALAPHPPPLLDEPFNSLDPVRRGAIIDDVRRGVADLAVTVLMVSHDASDAQTLGGRCDALPAEVARPAAGRFCVPIHWKI